MLVYCEMPRSLDDSKQWKRDQRARDKHVLAAGRAFKKLLKDLESYAETAKEEHPGRDKAARSRRARAFVKAVKNDPALLKYLDTYVGTDRQHPKAYSWRNAVVYQARDVLTQGKKLREAIPEVGKQAFKGFQAIEMATAQAPLQKALPEELRNFLPNNIIVEVDENGGIERITDRFENENLSLGKKIQKMHRLVRDYNKIAKRVKRDLKSGDEITKLSALITAIIMETGIRPGKAGNAAVKTVDGEKVEVETFGAITLGPSHVKFVRDNFAEIEFVGKKGGVNTAKLSDADIIKLLRAQTEKAKGSKFIFVTDDGQQVTYADIQKYFRDRFKGVAPTDFRKLRATDAVLSALRKEQENLYERIREFSNVAKKDLRSRVVEAIVETLERAFSAAQTALSHDSANTTRGAYINPEVVLKFLSTARADDDLESAILKGKKILSFDPETFVAQALAQAPTRSARATHRLGSTLSDLLESLEDELKDAGISV